MDLAAVSGNRTTFVCLNNLLSMALTGRGGPGRGQGRPSKADEEKVRNQTTEAIIQEYGSLEDGMRVLLRSGEASLIKFVWEHSIGKPRDKMELSTDPESPLQLIIQPIQTVSAPIEEKENDNAASTS